MGFFGSSERSDGKGGSSSMNHDKKDKKKKKDYTPPSLLEKAEKSSSSVSESKDADASRAKADIWRPEGNGEDGLRKYATSREEHGQSGQRQRQRSGSVSSSASIQPRKDKGKGREETTRSLNTSHVPGPGGSSYHPGLRAQLEAEKLQKRTKTIDDGQTGPVAINHIDATSSSGSSLSPPPIPNPGGLQVPQEKTGRTKKAAFREKKKSDNKKDDKEDEKKKDKKRDDRNKREGDEKKSGGSSGSSAEGSSSRRSGR